MRRSIALLLTLGSFFPSSVKAMETDQYMAWNIELKDSSQAFNDYFNDKLIPDYLNKINSRGTIPKSREELVIGLYHYAFRGLDSSRVKHFLNSSEEIDRYPDNSVSYREYKKESIYQSDAPFPWFFLPMSRTININGNYLGVDKIGHFFGFGRRYFQSYQRFINEGASHEKAIERTINLGIHNEKYLVGRLVDGVFSYADLEANYQGFLLALKLSSSEDYFKLENEKWSQAGKIDIKSCVNPDFDESYNKSDYWLLRNRKVLPRVKEYCHEKNNKIVKERFERYNKHEHSFSYEFVADY